MAYPKASDPVGVAHPLVEPEPVIVDDQMHLAPDRPAGALELPADQLHVLDRANLKPLEVSEQRVAALIIADPLQKAQAQEVLFEPHHGLAKEAHIHGLWIIHDRLKAHLAQDVSR